MSVNSETASAQGQTTVLEKESVYASLFEKIHLTPASSLGDINDFLDDAALSDAPAGERLTAAMQVFMDCIRKSGQQVEKLDKTLIDHHIAELDFQISRQLDAVMHHQEFQKVESLWRGLKQLVDSTDYRQNVKTEILDVSKDDLRQDFEDAPELIQSGLYWHTYTAEYDTPGGEPIGSVISSYEFDASPQDVALLRNISKVSAAAHMPFIGAVGPAFFMKDSMEEVAAIKDIGNYFDRAEYIKWKSFRDTDDSRYIGLVMPRVLGRLPYGPDNNIADVTDQLTLMSDVRQSPLIALMNTVAWQGQTGQKSEALSDSIIKSAKDLVGGQDKPAIDQSASGPQGPLDDTFGPLLQLLGKNKGINVMSADNSLSLQTYLTRITRVRLRLQQVASASDPQEMMQTLAQTVFQGKSVDLTDTQQYGSLISASLGEEWSGFGSTMFVQPLTQAWETVLQPSAASLNDKWSRSVVANWHTAFDGRFPFTASKSDASLPMLAEFVRKDSGRIERFLTTELGGVLHKEGSQWVPDKVNSQGLSFNPTFLRAINQLSQLSDILFTDGSQGITFELQARPVPQVVETQLTIDGQKLHYFNQMADWQSFRWPGDTYKPGTMLTWTTVNAGARLFGDYSGTWGFIRWLDQGKRAQLDRSQWMMSFTAPDGRTLQWVLRSQLGSGPLALLALRDFTLPDQIFSVDSAATAQALMTSTEDSDMDGTE